jgi:hypothetical protein
MAIETTQALRIKTVVTQDGELNIHGPFRAGDSVEVIVFSEGSRQLNGERYPLRGTLYTFIDPFGSVAENDWAALQ